MEPPSTAVTPHDEDMPDASLDSRDEQNQDSASLPPRPTRRFPLGWSLQDEEYESAPENGGCRMTDEGATTGGEENSEENQEIDETSLGQVRGWLQESYRDSLFACGGTIQIAAGDHGGNSGVEEPPSRPPSSSSQCASVATIPSAYPQPPIALHWDPRDASAPAGHCKLTFPVEKAGSSNLERLLNDMKPATFGLGGEDVYDESYRKASKLDPENFTTNFCPYSAGIVDVISQLLLPNPYSNKERAVRAELYKLNVYTGPSGHFRAHVDTPRSRSQIGSLVVCLPVRHEGGDLEVRHQGQTMTFDWASGSDSDSPQIQWAAFYSDCEHEVLPVRSGHRITLTYNLYVTRGNGQLSNAPTALDVAQTPLYRHLEALINDGDFLPEGGYLGYFTTHAYPHTTSKGCLADALKGNDMAIWQAFQRLGCGVCLRPVLVDLPLYSGKETVEIGRRFEVRASYSCIEEEDEWERMLEDSWYREEIPDGAPIWLNKYSLQLKQPSMAYATYGNEAHAALAYSVCAIIIGVPNHDDDGRRRLKKTFTTVMTTEDDWELFPPSFD